MLSTLRSFELHKLLGLTGSSSNDSTTTTTTITTTAASAAPQPKAQQQPQPAYPSESEDMARDRRRFPSLAATTDTASPSPSAFAPEIHPAADRVSREVAEAFLARWPFRGEAERRRFRAADFPRVTCLYFPHARAERIGFACRLLTLLFLVDDLLEEMGLEEGSAYNERLISISKGDEEPEPDKPAEVLTRELWEDMRACDARLAGEIKEPVFTFMRAQTDGSRLTLRELGAYFEYREKDVGQALLSALMRFSMALHLTPAQLRLAQPLERNCARHISVVNDIYSWRKEVRASETLHEEGAALCSSVAVLAAEASVPASGARRVLWALCREWEAEHRRMEGDLLRRLVEEEEEEGDQGGQVLRVYVRGLESQMSGNERWSESTPRYHKVK